MNSATSCLVATCPDCGAVRAGGFYSLPKDSTAMHRDSAEWSAAGAIVRRYDAPDLPAVTFQAHTEYCPRNALRRKGSTQ